MACVPLRVLVQLSAEVQALEHELDGGGEAGRAVTAELLSRRAQRRRRLGLPHVLRRGHRVGDLHAEAALEGGHHRIQLGRRQRAVEDVEHGALHELTEDLVLARVTERLQLDLARGGRHQGAEVAHARRGVRLAEADGPLERAGDEVLVVADAHTHGDAGALADLAGLAREVRQLGDDLLHVLGRRRVHAVGREGRALGLHDRDLVRHAPRVVGADLRAETVLERRDDAATVRVVLGVGARDDVHVDGQPHLVAADLDVALLHDVQEAHLDPLGEVRQLVEREDPAMRAGQQPIVDRQLVGEVAALGHLDRIDLADQIGDRDVGRGQLLAVAPVARQPGDLGGVAALGHALAARRADRRQRIVVDLAAGEHGHGLVEQAGKQPRDPRLGLAALAEQHDVLTAEHGVFDLGDHRVVVADDAGQERLAAPQPGDEVVPHLLLDRLRGVAAGAKLSDRPWLGHDRIFATMRRGPGSVNLGRPRRPARPQSGETRCSVRSGRSSVRRTASIRVKTVNGFCTSAPSGTGGISA